MPEIEAFRGLRYDLGHVGSLSDVVAPPYDVIGPEFQDQLYKRHPANIIRLELNRAEPGDTDESRYARAAQFLKNWRSEGVLVNDPDPALYVYHQEFNHGGRQLTRRGFMARVRLTRFGEGEIYPHEETMSGPKQDRLLLTTACKANLSQVFGLYPDPDERTQALLERAIAGVPAREATDHLGVVHRIWPVSDVSVISAVSGQMTAKPIFIADGHHRYETACNYRDQVAAGGKLPPGHPANFVLMMCVGMSDEGMIVLPTHRLFRGLPAMTSGQLAARLGDCFTTRIVGQGIDRAAAVWEEIELEGDQGTLAFTAADKTWTLATIAEPGRQRMAQAAAEHSPAWRELGVSLLHRFVAETLLSDSRTAIESLGIPEAEKKFLVDTRIQYEREMLPKPRYVHLVEEVVESLSSDTTGEFPLAALVMPATIEHIETISKLGERMPAKSTYFFPKLLSGLVINPLE